MLSGKDRLQITGMVGSMPAAVAAALALNQPDKGQLFIAGNKEEAYYLLNDLETLLDEADAELEQKRVLLFPSSYRKNRRPSGPMGLGKKVEDEGGDLFVTDNANVMQRSEVVKQLNSGRNLLVVTYPEALSEKVVSSRTLTRNTLRLSKGAKMEMDHVMEVLQDYDFERVDFVVEPGQFAVRGGIIDVFSYANEHPYRIEFFDDEIDSLRTFDPVSQLSIKQYDQISVLPNMERRAQDVITVEEKVPLLHYFGSNDLVWVQGLMFVSETLETLFANAGRDEQYYCSGNEFIKSLLRCRIIEQGNSTYFSKADQLVTQSVVQPAFHKQFDMLIDTLSNYRDKGYKILITIANEQQQRRLEKVFATAETHVDVIAIAKGQGITINNPISQVQFLQCQLNHGFVDEAEQLVCFTDHEIFERYHKYTVRDLSDAHQALTLKELFELKPGDYVTHIDYGVGRFSGLEKITTNGHTQEVIRLLYKNNDTQGFQRLCL